MSYRPSFLYKCLSYLYEINIEKTSSATNEYLEVSLFQGEIQLSSAKAIYSHGKKYYNFKKLLDGLDLTKLPGNNVLLLGLGLGSVLQLLEQENSYLHFTAVELDEEVVRLAGKYVASKLTSPLEIIVSDVYVFLEHTSSKFDLICMDVFIDDYIPDRFRTVDFCELMRDRLNSCGTIIYNCPAFNSESQKSSTDFFLGPFSKVFPEGKYIHSYKNYMLLNNELTLRK